HIQFGIAWMNDTIRRSTEVIDEPNRSAIKDMAEPAFLHCPGNVGSTCLAIDDRSGHAEARGPDRFITCAEKISAYVFEAREISGGITMLAQQYRYAIVDAKQSEVSFGAADVAGKDYGRHG